VEPGDDAGGRGEGECGHNHRITGTDALGAQGEHQRVGPTRAAYTVPRAAEAGELGLEGLDLGPEDEPPMRGHSGDRLVDRAPEAPPLRHEVDEGNGFGHRSA
jgi:hypothetical protein